MNQFLHFVAAITFFCMSAKHVSGQSTFYTALKTLEKSTHFMLTHVLAILHIYQRGFLQFLKDYKGF